MCMASLLKVPITKIQIKWLTELQKTALLAAPACQSVLLALFQKVTSIRSILKHALIVELVLTLARWEQSYQVNNPGKKQNEDDWSASHPRSVLYKGVAEATPLSVIS